MKTIRSIPQFTIRAAFVLAVVSAAMSLALMPLAGSLLSEEYIQRESTAHLQQQDWLSQIRPPPITKNTSLGILEDAAPLEDATMISGLVFFRNASFPSWTYEDLVFPSFSLVDTETSYSSNATINFITQALRPELQCETVPRDSINATVTPVPDEVSGVSGVVQLTLELTRPTSMFATANASISTCADAPFLSRDVNRNRLTQNATNIDRSFLWGNINNGEVTDLKWMLCKLRYSLVDVDLTLKLPGLDIDTENPPKPIESSKREAPLLEWFSGDESWAWNRIKNFALSNYLQDSDFSSCELNVGSIGRAEAAVTSSPWAIPEYWLHDDSKQDMVEAAFKKINTIVLVQLIHALGYRTPFSNMMSTGSNSSQYFARPAPIEVRLTDHQVRRLVQSSVSTWVVIGILAAVGLMTIGSIFLERCFKEVLPKNPQSIASMASMWADSNIFTTDPEAAELRTYAFTGRKYHMGWTKLADGELEREVYTIHIQDGAAREA
ncbi:hypothetical protein B0I35DRAFT_427216 [Stachybotrys elegans]|uniref:Transmembrane protein n=1 Tax=Stachybotrys elegans TaxID=80388 RepID=A0A8K0WT79_9HYPO|nr:hypothetical protein B0I35DRAFT_427216 [Stachybotrys elegans]